jgi:hypothetical protein
VTQAAFVFQTATKGPTITSQIGHTSLDSQAIGVRFQVGQAVTVDHMGAHILGFAPAPGPDPVPLSIVALTAFTDFPNSADRSTPDWLRTVQLTAPSSASADVEAAFAPITLQPGWYGLVCGNPIGGDSGAVLITNSDPVVIPFPVPFLGLGQFWNNLDGSQKWRLFTSEGSIPEPTSLGMAGLLSLAASLIRRRRANSQPIN